MLPCLAKSLENAKNETSDARVHILRLLEIERVSVADAKARLAKATAPATLPVIISTIDADNVFVTSAGKITTYKARYFPQMLDVATGSLDYVNEEVCGERVLIFRAVIGKSDRKVAVYVITHDATDVIYETYEVIKQLEHDRRDLIVTQKQLLQRAINASRVKLREGVDDAQEFDWMEKLYNQLWRFSELVTHKDKLGWAVYKEIWGIKRPEPSPGSS
jgi:hypothetical protein